MNFIWILILTKKLRNNDSKSQDTCGPVINSLRFQRRGCGFDPWLGKLASQMLGGVAQNNNNKQTNNLPPNKKTFMRQLRKSEH